MIFDRLAIGTANWGRKYNGAKVSEDDQKRILDFCQSSGIDTIDTATAYGWDWSKVNSFFNLIIKVQADDDLKPLIKRRPYCIMEHTSKRGRSEEVRMKAMRYGISVYSRSDIDFPVDKDYRYDVIQLPYSIYDRRFEDLFPLLKGQNTEIHVRSIFLRGRLLQDFNASSCIDFCLMNPCIDKVIIGADSFEQFRDNLRHLHRMNSVRKTDEKFLERIKNELGTDNRTNT